ncbi:hypothetical protein CDEST_05541 [Colletotrichum destructivum]|uniref:Uncharacterized protein n=1 Tax=Colletotrichum destructivum TaxID=34406 RepID=A0AAX4IB30_9PEZI|nr:hypothetical protein CDEST_05541 [Colletotrichum destructivum]
MSLQYTAEFLVHLRESPLCIKPPALPPAEEWMGPLPDNSRTQGSSNNNNSQTKTPADRRSNDNPLLDQTNRRPALDRHVSRNSANPEDIILGPPRTAFASATLRNGKPFDSEKGIKDADSPSRFNFRNRNGDTPEGDRFRDSRNANFRRRGDGDQDQEGWSTVKPRKSFGHEGAERFQGRMGAGGGDRLPNERRPRDRDDREGHRDRTLRTFEHHDKDKDHDHEEAESRPRNGLSRGKSEPWFKNDSNSNNNISNNSNVASTPEKPPMTARERIDRAKSWRDRNRDAEPVEEKTTSRNYERRWDRGDHRQEREPEWFDEPAGEKSGGHTEEDFKKFMESMKASRNASAGDKAPVAVAEAAIKAEQPAVASAPAVEVGPDQFFLKFASTAGLDAGSPIEPNKETPAKPKTGGGKSSRFTSFFNAPQDDPSRRMQTEPSTPLAGLSIGAPDGSAPAPDSEKQAFQALLMKLQRSNVQSSTPPASHPFQEPPPLAREPASSSSVASPEPFQQYGGERREEHRPRMPQASMSMSDILAPRPTMPGQQPAVRQDQLLQELVGQRHQASSQGSGRMEPNQGRNMSNTEFLMNLMRNQPEPPRTEQLLMRMPQPQRAAQIPHAPERDPDFPQGIPQGIPQGMPQGGRGSQRQMRGQGPPGFMDEAFHHPEPEARMQPTQILQRPPPPPGLDQMNPNWIQGGGPLPPQQRSIIPPPGLAGGPGRNHPMGAMFPPNFPPGAFPPPEVMAGPPPRNMPPPPGFFGGPPPGFIPPPGMPGFPGPAGPEGHGFHFDGRMPPPGAAQAFRRQ